MPPKKMYEKRGVHGDEKEMHEKAKKLSRMKTKHWPLDSKKTVTKETRKPSVFREWKRWNTPSTEPCTRTPYHRVRLHDPAYLGTAMEALVGADTPPHCGFRIWWSLSKPPHRLTEGLPLLLRLLLGASRGEGDTTACSFGLYCLLCEHVI